MKRLVIGIILIGFTLFVISCSADVPDDTAVSTTTTSDILTLPQLSPAALNGQPLQVIASTSIIGDVVAQVGGDAIDLTTLIGPGQDPHSYEPAARDLTAVTSAHVIFLNGWDLEETLANNLETIAESVPVIPISANITPLNFGENAHEHEAAAEIEDDHGRVDPHVWFSIQNVIQWVKNVETVLTALDPANTATYQTNAQSYLAELEALNTYVQAEVAAIPEEKRFLVTNHGAFNYFAQEYQLEIVGTVIPSMSTMAEPSASDLAQLIGEMERHNICTIFTETTVSANLAQTVADELKNCDQVQVVPLYTGSIGPTGSGADSYITMFRTNVDAITAGLK